jgi:hypothetical protein
MLLFGHRVEHGQHQSWSLNHYSEWGGCPFRRTYMCIWLGESDLPLEKFITFLELWFILYFFFYGKYKEVITPTHFSYTVSENCSALFRIFSVIESLFYIFPETEYYRMHLKCLPIALTFLCSMQRWVTSEGWVQYVLECHRQSCISCCSFWQIL